MNSVERCTLLLFAAMGQKSKTILETNGMGQPAVKYAVPARAESMAGTAVNIVLDPSRLVKPIYFIATFLQLVGI